MFRPWRAASAVFFVYATALAEPVAQGSRNVELLAQVPMSARVSDCWGHVDPVTGKEYAIIGNYEGTLIFDCADPRNPILRGFIQTEAPGSSGNRWRDMKVFGTHLYVVSEAHGGVQIIDLGNPDAPVKVKLWGGSLWSSAHNIAMDLDLGIAYVCGSSSGMHVLDVATDPANPGYLVGYSSTYVHDLAVQNGLAFLCDNGTNRFNILDVAALPALPLVSTTRSAGTAACHSIWPSRDNRIVAICHETSGGQLVVYDVSAPGQPALMSSYQTGGASAIIHNPMLVDRTCHVAWNTEGYQAIDLSDPSNPVRVGYHDTWSGASAGFEGMWGVYARQPSGVIYGSDRTGGLLVFKPKCTSTRYGVATPGSATPEIHTAGSAWAGNQSFRLEISAAAASRPGFLAIGGAPSGVVLQGLALAVDFAQPHVLLPIATNAQGDAGLPVPLAGNLPVGVQLHVQALISDPAGPLGFSASAGLQFETFSL